MCINIFVNRSTVTAPNLSLFSFRRNEVCAQVRVAMLLYFTFRDNRDLVVEPSFEVELPFTKKGPHYHTDYSILLKQPFSPGTGSSSSDTSIEPPASTGTGMLVLCKKIPVIVIEVKTTVSAQFEFVKESDCIELLIYCLYIARIKNLQSIMGCLTDGNSWHILKTTRNENVLIINDYMTYTSCDTKTILNILPQLLNFR